MIVELDFLEDIILLEKYLGGTQHETEKTRQAVERLLETEHRDVALGAACSLLWKGEMKQEKIAEKIGKEQRQFQIFKTLTKEWKEKEREDTVRDSTIGIKELPGQKWAENTGRKITQNRIHGVLFLCSTTETPDEDAFWAVPVLLFLSETDGEHSRDVFSVLSSFLARCSRDGLCRRNIHGAVFESLSSTFALNKDMLSFSCLVQVLEKTETPFARPFFDKTDALMEIVIEHGLADCMGAMRSLLKESISRFRKRLGGISRDLRPA
ncbi:MAG: uncharacterized protein A8A55_0559 [Amphiamblys sp. WSBS2006]|nr:MAG: uncharacterized protein A8A55_0559 [Amphiamblys sp. WSBS2006]